MAGAPYLELEQVEAWQGPRPVLQGVDLRLHLGEHTVVLGPNGAGKSALIKLLTRELYPVVQAGSSLRLFGHSTVNLWELRGRMGHVSADLQAGYRPQIATEEVVLSGWFGSVGIGRHHQATATQRMRAHGLLHQMGLGGWSADPSQSCPMGSGAVSCWRAPSCIGRSCWCWMSPPMAWIPRPGICCCDCCGSWRSKAPPCCW